MKYKYITDNFLNMYANMYLDIPILLKGRTRANEQCEGSLPGTCHGGIRNFGLSQLSILEKKSKEN